MMVRGNRKSATPLVAKLGYLPAVIWATQWQLNASVRPAEVNSRFTVHCFARPTHPRQIARVLRSAHLGKFAFNQFLLRPSRPMHASRGRQGASVRPTLYANAATATVALIVKLSLLPGRREISPQAGAGEPISHRPRSRSPGRRPFAKNHRPAPGSRSAPTADPPSNRGIASRTDQPATSAGVRITAASSWADPSPPSAAWVMARTSQASGRPGAARPASARRCR